MSPDAGFSRQRNRPACLPTRFPFRSVPVVYTVAGREERVRVRTMLPRNDHGGLLARREERERGSPATRKLEKWERPEPWGGGEKGPGQQRHARRPARHLISYVSDTRRVIYKRNTDRNRQLLFLYPSLCFFSVCSTGPPLRTHDPDSCTVVSRAVLNVDLSR